MTIFRHLKAVIIAIFVIGVLAPGYTQAREIDIYIDKGGINHIETIEGGLSSFLKMKRADPVRVKLFGLPSVKKDERLFKNWLADFNLQSVEEIKSLEEELQDEGNADKTLILISSGTGKWDDIKELLREQEAIRLNVIGVHLPDLDTKGLLEGLASASGGLFYTANNSGELQGIFHEIERNEDYNFMLRAYKSRNEEITDSLMSRYKYLWNCEVYGSLSPDVLVDSSHIFPVKFNLPAGTYNVKVTYMDDIIWIRNVKVEESGRKKRVDAYFSDELTSLPTMNSH